MDFIGIRFLAIFVNKDLGQDVAPRNMIVCTLSHTHISLKEEDLLLIQLHVEL